MRKTIVSASDIGKTTYCPHAHYLSTKFRVDKVSHKRLQQGTYKHELLNKKVESRSFFSLFIKVVLLVAAAIAIGMTL